MSLDQRLERARDDYRALPVAGEDPQQRLVTGGAANRGRSRGRWLVAAVALVAVVGAAVVASRDRPPEVTAAGDQAGTASTTAEPAGRSVLVLDPPGPYEDGQEVVVRVPADLDVDLGAPGAIVMCTDRADADGGGSTGMCGSRVVPALVVPGTAGTHSVTVRLTRTVDSGVGAWDCADERVTCQLEIRLRDGARRRSSILTFAGAEPPSRPATMGIEPGEAPGTFRLRPSGLAADPTWLAWRAEHPDGVADHPAFTVLQCAAGATGVTEGPFGVDLWDQGPPAGPDESLCGVFVPPVTIDPDDPDRPLTVTLPTFVYSYGGWADCRIQRCSLEVLAHRVSSTGDDGRVRGDQVTLARSEIPAGAVWADAERPSLTVVTPGPHRSGGTVTVTVAGLSEGEGTVIGLCHVAAPWGCSYDLTPVGNGTHEVALHEDAVAGCGTAECYLELDADDEGVPPLATAPLDTPG